MGEAKRKKTTLKQFFPEADLSIVQAGHPVLRCATKDVPAEMFGSQQLKALVDTMIVVMRQAPGVGLAATQIGVGLRVAVIEDRAEYLDDQDEEDLEERERAVVPLRVLVNPRLTLKKEEGEHVFDEGCLSVRGYVAKVTRANAVRVVACDVDGNEFVWEPSGWAARIAQHECDHLDGNLYVDIMDSRTLTATSW